MSTATMPRYSVPDYYAPSQDAPAHYRGVPATQKRIKTGIPREFREQPADNALANFLGAFSIGLGLAEALAPRLMADLTGVRYPALIRAYGVREIGTGIGILTSRQPAGWLWARIAGDVLDLGTLAAAYREARSDADKRKVVIAAAAVAGVTALDVLAAEEHTFGQSTC